MVVSKKSRRGFFFLPNSHSHSATVAAAASRRRITGLWVRRRRRCVSLCEQRDRYIAIYSVIYAAPEGREIFFNIARYLPYIYPRARHITISHRTRNPTTVRSSHDTQMLTPGSHNSQADTARPLSTIWGLHISFQ